MANRSGGRQRLLAVYEILREFSDEEVPLTKTQICKLLYEEYNLEADQRTLQSDLDCLMDAGFVRAKRNKGFHFTSHPFENWELKMLVDGVAQTDYFEPRTLNHIIEKIISLAGPTDAELLRRNRPALDYAVEERDLYLSKNLSTLISAVKELHPVQFEYFKLNENKVPVPHGSGSYTVHPYEIVKRNTFYYLVSYQEGDAALRYFRVDRMRNVVIQKDRKRLSPCHLPIGDKTDEIHHYLRNNTDSFWGEKVTVVVRLDALPSILYDVFGIENVNLAAKENPKIFCVKAQDNAGLYHNIMKLGASVTVLAPEAVRTRYLCELQKMLSNYDKSTHSEI